MKGKDLKYSFLKIALLWSAIFISTSLFSQEKGQESKKIKIINADLFKKDASMPDAQKLIGNVEFEHDGVKLYCDSAYLYSDNSLDAFSRVQINQGDTINVFSDTLYFNGNNKLAKFRGNVRLRDRDYKLDTDSMDYDVDKSVGIYRNFGTITSVKDDNVLTSYVGRYEADKKRMFFKDSVRLVNPSYIFESDTLEYETETEIAYFFGPTTITSDSSYIYCEKGMYDTQNEIAQLVKEAYVLTNEQTLLADSIYYEKESEIGEGFGCVMLIDTTQKIHYTGNYAYRNEMENRAVMHGDALLRQYEGKDTLYIHADTIRLSKTSERVRIVKENEAKDTLLQIQTDSIPTDSLIDNDSSSTKDSVNIQNEITFKDTVKELTTIFAYYGVKWKRDKMRGVCDSLHFTEKDSVLKMHRRPAVWNDSTQITGDTIFVKNYEGKTEGFKVFSNAFILQIADSSHQFFNQIKGRDMLGKMKDNEIKRVNVIGNGETIYFIEEEEEKKKSPHLDSLFSDTLSQKDTLKQKDTLSIKEKQNEPKQKRFTGMNYMKCSEMVMIMVKKEIESITFIEQPDGVVHPIDRLAGVSQKIDGFKIRFVERPNTIEDLLSPPYISIEKPNSSKQ